VDYSYDVGGTYAYAQTDQTFNVNWGLSNYINVFFRYFDSAPQLISGAPSFPLNTVRSSLYGARADIPLRVPFEPMAGGSFEREDRRETVSPYRRDAEDLYIQAEEPLFGTGNFRLSTRRLRVDYANSIQDVNLIGYDFRYWSRHWFGLDVSLDGSYERDTGGPVLRRRVIGSAKAQWRYRKATLTLDLARTRETQGTFERGRTLVQLLGRRDF